MTIKRFQWVFIADDLVELNDNGIVKILSHERLEELLNELSEENEQLIQENKELKEDIDDLRETLAFIDGELEEMEDLND